MHVCISFHVMILSPHAGRSAESSRASTPKCPVWSIVDPGEGPRWDSQVTPIEMWPLMPLMAVQTMGISPGFIGPNMKF